MNIATRILQNKPQNQTVFTTIEIKQLCKITNQIALHSALIYATNRNHLYRITRGIYALNQNYSKEEFANKFRRPSYISLYTVLQQEGIVFQPYTSVYAIANRSEAAQVNRQKYVYRKIKDEILLNSLGVENKNGVSKAAPERALCDKLYLDGDEYFDNLRNIDWSFISQLNEDVYQNNPSITKFIKQYSQ